MWVAPFSFQVPVKPPLGARDPQKRRKPKQLFK